MSLLSLSVLSTNGRFPQVIEFGFQPTWLLVGSSQVLRNRIEFWMFLLDGATLTVVLLHEAQKLAVPERRRIRGLSQKGGSLRGDARFFPAGFGVDGFDLLLPKRLARSGVSLSIELNIHDRKKSNGL